LVDVLQRRPLIGCSENAPNLLAKGGFRDGFYKITGGFHFAFSGTKIAVLGPLKRVTE
jgi:hypothetical protein